MSNGSFGSFWLAGFLRSMGYPRKRGFWRTDIVDLRVLEPAIDVLGTIATGIGAGRPRTAVALLGETFRRDWSLPFDDLLALLQADYEVPNVKAFVQALLRAEGPDWRWAALGDEEFQLRLAWNVAACA